jgi:hypothetical protein
MIPSVDYYFQVTYVFDVRARVDGDNITVLDSQVVTDDSVDASAAVIKVVIGQDNQNCVLPLLSAHEDCVTAEQLQLLHGVVGQGNDRVVIVGGISHPSKQASVSVAFAAIVI